MNQIREYDTYIYNNTRYHTPKYTKNFHCKIELLRMIWPPQSLDNNLIENFSHH